MPTIRKGESSQSFISRCIPMVMEEGKTQKQAAGKCYGMLRQARGKRTLKANKKKSVTKDYTTWRKNA